MVIIQDEKAWAGTEASLKAALDAEEGIATRMAAGMVSPDDDDDDEDYPRLLNVEDGVATISIKGPLVNSDSWWNEIMGVTGYPEIRDALIEAANDPEAKAILLDIDSGGGAVSGVGDTADLIRTIHEQVKPVTAFTDGIMASAAYWLGSSAGDVYAGRTAVVGSIGVLSTHMERSQALKEAGIGVTVIRAGKYKALANSVEPLSAEGKKQIQQVVDAAYVVFVEHVADMRGKSYEYADQTMAQGQEFVGQAAADVNLVDGITSFDEVLSALKAKSIDASNNFMDNRGKPSGRLVGSGGVTLSGETEMKKRHLTAQQIAALQAGAPLAQGADTQHDDNAAAAAAAGAAAEGEEHTAEAAAGAAAGEEQGTAAAEAGSAVEQKADNSVMTVQFLTAQLKEKDETIISARVEIEGLKKDLLAAQATHSPLLEIAAKSVNHMRVALNLSPLDFSAMNSVQVLAEHKNMTEQFTAQFTAGGVAAVNAEQSKKNESVTMDAMAHARLAAAPRFSRT